MKITILCENSTSYAGAKTCSAEWGLSLYIELATTNILFDTGHTAIYRKNAEKLDIDLQKTDTIVLSHFHWDHVGGLYHHPFTAKKNLILHPDILTQIPKDLALKISSDFTITPSVEPLEFAPDVYYLGHVPRKTSFEKGANKNNPMKDDTAIALKTPEGVIVITGCSHAGICNICEYAKKVTRQKLYAVIGGFHLTEENQKAINGTIDYFKAQKVEHLYPMHCVDFPTMAKFHKLFKVKKMGTGDVIELPA